MFLDYRPQAAAGRIPENRAGAGGRARAEAARLRQEAAAGKVQNWKRTGGNPQHLSEYDLVKQNKNILKNLRMEERLTPQEKRF